MERSPPGTSNERLLEDIAGTWQDCKIRGEIIRSQGLKYFKWNPYNGEIDAKIFISRFLPEKLLSIDQFEDIGFYRILIPAKVGEYWIIANIYGR